MKIEKISRTLFALAVTSLAWIAGYAFCQQKPLIFPLPLEVQVREGRFDVDKSTFIMSYQRAREGDDLLARLLSQEFVDRYGQPMKIMKRSSIGHDDKFILLGTISHPLVKRFCEQNGLMSALRGLGDEEKRRCCRKYSEGHIVWIRIAPSNHQERQSDYFHPSTPGKRFTAIRVQRNQALCARAGKYSVFQAVHQGLRYPLQVQYDHPRTERQYAFGTTSRIEHWCR
jgi:ribosomal protein L21E